MEMVPCKCGCEKEFPYGAGKRKYYSEDCRTADSKKRRAEKRAGQTCAAGCGKTLNASRISGYQDTCSAACKRKMKGLPEPERSTNKGGWSAPVDKWHPDQGKGNASLKIRQEYCLQKAGGFAAPCQNYKETIGQGCYDGSCYRP